MWSVIAVLHLQILSQRLLFTIKIQSKLHMWTTKVPLCQIMSKLKYPIITALDYKGNNYYKRFRIRVTRHPNNNNNHNHININLSIFNTLWL